ncbi:MAG: hypothetical protein HOP09_13295 [Hyphomicrobium sp.]|nr:hypothetical protein [Hyphomicrobium sp.]
MTKTFAPGFEPGQIWRYHHRPGEDQSLLAVLAVRDDEKLGAICSIAIAGVAIANPHVADGIQRHLPHAPISAEVLAGSVIELVATDGPTADHADFAEAYQQWLEPFERREAGVFTITPAEIVSLIEDTVRV